MKKIIVGLYFLLFGYDVLVEIPDTDLILPKIAAEKNDSARARLVWDCLGTSETDPVLDMQIAEKLLIQSRLTKDPIEEVIALACLGYDYRVEKNKKLRLATAKRTIEKLEKNGDSLIS